MRLDPLVWACICVIIAWFACLALLFWALDLRIHDFRMWRRWHKKQPETLWSRWQRRSAEMDGIEPMGQQWRKVQRRQGQ